MLAPAMPEPPRQGVVANLASFFGASGLPYALSASMVAASIPRMRSSSTVGAGTGTSLVRIKEEPSAEYWYFDA